MGGYLNNFVKNSNVGSLQQVCHRKGETEYSLYYFCKSTKLLIKCLKIYTHIVFKNMAVMCW